MDNFRTFLAHRGVKEVPKRKDLWTIRPSSVQLASDSYDEVIYEEYQDSESYNRLTPIHIRETGEEVEDPGSTSIKVKEYSYIATDEYRSRRMSKGPDEAPQRPFASFFKSGHHQGPPESVQDAYHNWEFHDDVTMNEIDGNGGVYDPFRPDLTAVDSSDPFTMLRLAPAAKFRDSLQLKHVGLRKLRSLEGTRKYKNNLSVTLGQYFVTCAGSDVVMYEFDKLHMPTRVPVFAFDTRPNFTSHEDRLASTWPHFPHTINFAMVGQFCGQNVLALCVDDAMVYLYKEETLVEQVSRFSNKLNGSRPAGSSATTQNENDSEHEIVEDDTYIDNRFRRLKVKPDYSFRTGASCWGIDLLDNFIVILDNCQSLTLLAFADNRFSHCQTFQLDHNIPEVLILSNTFDEATGCTRLAVSCVSILGEVIEIEFVLQIFHGPLDELDALGGESIMGTGVDAPYRILDEAGPRLDKFRRFFFHIPEEVLLVLLPSDCWTVKAVGSRFFKRVQSIRAMTGDPWIDEVAETESILRESTILGGRGNPRLNSDLGMSTEFQFFESPVLHFGGPNSEDEDPCDSAEFTDVDDTFRRIKKVVEKKTSSLKGLGAATDITEEKDAIILAVSTSKRLGLFASRLLLCLGATRKVFDVAIPFNDESRHLNRILISLVIEELQCWVALTQQGLVTIMRLCQHRGLYGMRQEHLFPNALSLALGYNGYRTIIGLTARNISVAEHLPRYLLYVTYLDGIVLTYELKMDQGETLEVDLF